LASGEIEELIAAWAKTAPDGGWHPLAHHAIDTAAVASLLWDRMLSAQLRGLVAEGLGLPNADGAERWLRLCAWLHDVGKLTCWFQRLDSIQAQRLGGRGWSLEGGVPAKHGAVSVRVMEERLSDLGSRYDVRALAAAVGGHHGAFLSGVDPLDALEELRDRFARFARERTGPHESLGEVTNPALATIAGLITLADWVASNVLWFPPTAETADTPIALLADINGYEEHAAARAERAWQGLHWAEPRVISRRDRLRDLFPFIRTPTPVQQAAADLADDFAGPALCVIEDRTGSGKTEAAILMADAFISRGVGRGLFFGLPTRATADQAYARVVAALGGVADPDHQVRVELVHGFASLTPAYRQLAPQPELLDIAHDEEQPVSSASERVIAGGWFSQRKRGLLAPAAVGTVDQAMLAALPSKHFTLRLLGLAGKVVVLDEVHAYDVYMGTIVQRLLEWLASLECPVVLLSATLPISAREELLAAYSRGRGKAVRGGDDEATRYPRMTVVSDDVRRELAVQSSGRRVTRVELREQDQTAVATEVIALATAGLEVAVIANTVGRARAWLSAIERLAPPGLATELLHARFRLVDRAVVEARVLAAYGPHAERPGGSIVVATQVLEQSLDLDFDLVVSELAPVDLLMQRAGRSHRHARERSNGAGEGPWLWVVTPPCDADGLPIIGRESVYDEHLLLRSFVALRDHLFRSDGVVVEDESASKLDDLVQRVYGEDELGVSSGRWRTTKEAMRTARDQQRGLASVRLIVPPGSPHLITDLTGELFDEEDPAAPLPPKTRLGPDPIRALLLALADREELGRLLPSDPVRPYPPELVAWLTMRTASLPRGPWRGQQIRPEDDGLARLAPALAWVHRVNLDGDARGELLGVPVRNDRRLGVLVGAEVNAG
jgi:CRISPR-associated endonuclease/helicase Cas3